MKKNIIISLIISVLLMIGIYLILSNSTVEVKTTKVDIQGKILEKDKLKDVKEVKKEAKKNDDNNTQYVIHNTETNEKNGNVGYGIFTLNGEKIKDLKEIYSLYTEGQLKEKYKLPSHIVFSDGIYNYFYDKNMDYQGKYYKINDKENSLQYIINNGNLYMSTYKYGGFETNKIIKFPSFEKMSLNYTDKQYILNEGNQEIYGFTNLGHIIINKKVINKNQNGTDITTYTKMLYSENLEPILKNGFDDIYEYKTKYEGFDLNFYVIKTNNNKYYVYYIDKGKLVNLSGIEDNFNYQINMGIKNNKLFIFNRDGYISYNLDINEYETDGKIDLGGGNIFEIGKEIIKELKLGKKEIGKLQFDLDGLKKKGVSYNYIRLDGIGEYNGVSIYKVKFSIYKDEGLCILGMNCQTKTIEEFKIYDINGNEISDKKASIYISKEFEQKGKYDFEHNYAKLTKGENVINGIRGLKNIKLFNDDITTKINYNYGNYYSSIFKEYIFSIEQTPNGVYFKNSISGEKASDTFNEILWYNENENLFSLINDKNENCLYKIIDSKLEKQYCAVKQILGYKNGYILEGTGYSGDFGKIVEKDGIKIFEKLNFKNKAGKDIIVSEFNILNDYILLIDTENNFYLFEKDKLLYSGKREGRDDLEIFLVNKNILKNSILKD